MLNKLLLEVEERFQIAKRGLVLAPDFSVPEKGTWSNFTTNIEIENENGNRIKAEANFEIVHFNISDPNVGVEKRWRVVVNLPDTEKEQVPIGSKIYTTSETYTKLVNENNA